MRGIAADPVEINHLHAVVFDTAKGPAAESFFIRMEGLRSGKVEPAHTITGKVGLIGHLEPRPKLILHKNNCSDRSGGSTDGSS